MAATTPRVRHNGGDLEIAEVLENAADSDPEDRAGRGISLVPTPSPMVHLKTLDDVRVEMAKVYRDMKRGKLPTHDGTRLVYVLSQIGRVIEVDKISARVEAVERVLRLRGER
jgi:hypothetical protein